MRKIYIKLYKVCEEVCYVKLLGEVPILSTYMGHDRIYGTEKYLHMTGENSADNLACMEKFNEGLFPKVDE